MNPGDVAYTKDWDTAVVKSVSLLELDEPVEVFNFEVEDCHTYFVGEISLLVHNGCRSKNKLKPDLNAQGDHTVFRRGHEGSRNKYATYKQNPKILLDLMKCLDLMVLENLIMVFPRLIYTKGILLERLTQVKFL